MSHMLYMAFSGMESRAARLEIVANNLANARTAGFKRELSRFQIDPQLAGETSDQLSLQIKDPVVSVASDIDFSVGDYTRTENPLHLALGAEGFFAVSTPQGVRYTRDGAFQLNGQRELVNSSGHRVLGERGPIRIPDGAIEVNTLGTVQVDALEVDRLTVVHFDDLNQLRREGANLFAAPDGLEPRPPRQLDVRQGLLEESNLSPLLEMAELVESMRGFEILSRAVRAIHDDVDGKLIDDVGRS